MVDNKTGHEEGTCGYNHTGVCSRHDIEVERRSTQNRKIDKLEEEIKDLLKEKVSPMFLAIGRLKAFRAQAQIASVIAGGIFTGSFIYTHNHKVESNAIIRDLVSSQNEYKERVITLEGEVNGMKSGVSRLIDELSDTNRKLGELIDRIPKQ